LPSASSAPSANSFAADSQVRGCMFASMAEGTIYFRPHCVSQLNYAVSLANHTVFFHKHWHVSG
jgi:hypothetical protein